VSFFYIAKTVSVNALNISFSYLFSNFNYGFFANINNLLVLLHEKRQQR